VHGLIADGPGGAWTFGSSILTFAFPMILFIVVAAALYVVYTKPESTPGHRPPGPQRPVSYTAVPGLPLAQRQERQAQAEPATRQSPPRPAAAGTATTVPGEGPDTEDAE
jgi:hypothetical protein